MDKIARIIYALIILLVMSVKATAQDMPVSDVIGTSAGNVEMRFIGHGSLMFNLNNYYIYIDPVRTSGSYDNLPKADLILVTHEHGDHLDPDLISNLRKQTTIMLSSEKAAAKIPWAQIMRPGDKNTVNGITVEAIPAYNMVNLNSAGQPFHPKGSGNGYIITFGDKRFYIAGDTENTPEMKTLKNIEVAFLPMNLPYTMTPAMVADAARAFKPVILYPYHYGDTNTEDLIKLLKDTDIIVKIRNLK